MCCKKLFGFAAAIVVCVCLIGSFARSGDAPATPDKSKPGAAMDPAMMKAMMDAATPGPHHKELEAMAGKFRYTNKCKMDPAQDWMTSEGDYDGDMALDGRYLLSNVKGPMMGSEFVGMGCLGYDNTLQKHVAAWIDNMGTGIMRAEGTCDASTKTITFQGEMMCPIRHKQMPYKFTYEIKSNDEFTMRWWAPSMTDDKMFESMVIDYKRVK